MILVNSSTVVPANDFLSEPHTRKRCKMVGHSHRSQVPLRHHLVVHVGQCVRSPQGVGVSCKERKQYVIPRIYIIPGVDASLYFTHPRAMRAWISAGVEVNRPRLDGYSHGMPQRVGSLFCFGR